MTPNRLTGYVIAFVVSAVVLYMVWAFIAWDPWWLPMTGHTVSDAMGERAMYLMLVAGCGLILGNILNEGM